MTQLFFSKPTATRSLFSFLSAAPSAPWSSCHDVSILFVAGHVHSPPSSCLSHTLTPCSSDTFPWSPSSLLCPRSRPHHTPCSFQRRPSQTASSRQASGLPCGPPLARTHMTHATPCLPTFNAFCFPDRLRFRRETRHAPRDLLSRSLAPLSAEPSRQSYPRRADLL